MSQDAHKSTLVVLVGKDVLCACNKTCNNVFTIDWHSAKIVIFLYGNKYMYWICKQNQLHSLHYTNKYVSYVTMVVNLKKMVT
jgi:hypothetical protein